MNLVIIGTGYVGLTTGVGYATLGHKVACVDVDERKIAELDHGSVPFYEPGVQAALTDAQEAGRIMFTTDLASVMSEAEVIMIAVGTPSTSTGEADLSYVEAAAKQIGTLLKHEAVVVMKSTVPVGTNRRIIQVIREAMKEAGQAELTSLINIVSVPEFLREGSALDDFLQPDRIVIGAEDKIAAQTIDRLHGNIRAPRVMTGLESAELIKYAANAFLATKISFINEIANLADRVGADVRHVAEGIGYDHRIGPHFLQAGIGYGGSCFPKDVSALEQISGSNGYGFKLISAVIEVNNRQRDNFFKRIAHTLGPLKGRRIAVWGLAFKPHTDDIRESAAIDITRRLLASGAEICAFDPEASENAKAVLPDHIEFAPTAIDAATGAEALIVLTEWPEFQNVSFSTLKSRMVGDHVFDGRNCLADHNLSQHGFQYHGVGLCS
ncbi:UDP-glucose 6-dehydrogenase [Candidatus Uhrbacteria bacterium CG_4_9_14_3_um_filter_50_9]|uniref:UDP-glucose 6-dehydrogenase n=1 Tax=Candidatus Uhrbacteria bacterium CG_4_9_14_3_um_filter_50_9 TaxID=1975035 RepID=A0A2M7XEQ2_9BACT|nr:MAG: UDP-glucose 6-dehydrogenase [Candidatus Uhrbacteria bacterium CG_4_9_14_3_um_filter_50_9]